MTNDDDIAAEALGLGREKPRKRTPDLRMPKLADPKHDTGPDYSSEFVWSREDDSDTMGSVVLGLLSWLTGFGTLVCSIAAITFPVLVVIAGLLGLGWIIIAVAQTVVASNERQCFYLRQLREDQRLATRFICREMRRDRE